MGAVVSHETCAIQTTGYQPGKIVYKPGQMWTLTVNDELKTDENDFCLKTTGLLEGTWSDPWSKGKIFDVKMDGDKITYSECDGDLVGKWADAFNNNDEYKLCMNSKTGAVTMPGASGTFLHGKMEMSFGGGPIHTATLSGDKLNWDNNNVWTKVANSEDAMTPTIDGGVLTWPFLTATHTANVMGDELHWDNGNVWSRTSGLALEMAPCDGSAGQKWTITESGEVKSQLDDMTCVAISGTAGAVTVTKCGGENPPSFQVFRPSALPEIDLTES